MSKLLSKAAVGAVALVLAACGGSGTDLAGTGTGGSTSSGGTGGTGSGSTSTTYTMGNGSGSGFQPQVIGISSANVSAGGSTSLSVTIVDKTGILYAGTDLTVTFNSPCIAQGLAVVTASGTSVAGSSPNTVTTSTGSISATYTAKGCSGSDVITASSTINSGTLSATGTVTVASGTIGSIQFVSATPTTIGLKGTGLAETSTVVFKVVDATGAARPGASVNFSLDTTVGGLTLSPSTATSGADGTVQTVVSSGTQHTPVRVTAKIVSPALSTQSSQLTVSTGIPASAGFSISVGSPSYASSGNACTNVEAYGVDGVTVPVTVRLSDRYNNPAMDGTSVAFYTNGGHIVGSCTTPSAAGAADGTCTATWTSANPRPLMNSDTPALKADGRATILATAIGEESFTDTNGNGYWDTGEPFVDLGEPYDDANENGMFDSGEYFLDFNQSSTRDAGDGTFKGITCTGAPPTCSNKSLAIGATHLLIMSTSGAQISAMPVSGFGTAGSAYTIPHSTTTPAVTNSGTLQYTVMDLNGNPMAAGTTVTVTADSAIGTISGPGANWTIGCRSALGGDTLSVSLAAGTSAASGNITITVTSPGTKTVTVYVIPVQVQ